MKAIEKVTRASHLIDMDDIIREGNPTLRAVAEDVTFPLSDQEIILGEKMMQFLHHSQDPVMAEKLGLRGGVGLAAPQLDISKRIIAVLVPNPEDADGNPPKEAYSLQEVMYNPKVVAHSVQDAALGDGEGCLSVDRNVPGYVVRHARVTVEYFTKDGEKKRIKLKGYNSIVVQHEIDHTNGIMFYDRINPNHPIENKEGLFSYDVATETVTMEVTVDGDAEGEAGTEQGQAQPQTVTFTKHTYTVVYAGDSYFADHVFHLTDKQKELAKNYAENLTAFFGTASSGIVAAINLSDEVLSYRPAVERAAAKYGMSDYVDLILAVMMQESGGRGLDVMQAAEGGFNTRYPHVPNGITDPEYSIECGVQELKYALDKAGCTGPTDLDRIKLALQGYNYGSAYIDWAMERDGGYTKENAIAYSDMMCARPSWPYDLYGDKEYVDHVLRYYQITASGGSYPANGMQIPHYLQTDYGNIPYGGGSIASSGCGPTSFAMIASYLTGTTITPIDAISWCGNSYYKPGVGTYWSYFQAASDHFGCGAVTQTSDPNQVLQALSEGHPVISSQRAGLFTSGGHFIVLRGVTAGGKVLVNDPNDSSSKNYINREFDMMTEVHATANAYWIFAKK